jgi:hypothetical protein
MADLAKATSTEVEAANQAHWRASDDIMALVRGMTLAGKKELLSRLPDIIQKCEGQ